MLLKLAIEQSLRSWLLHQHSQPGEGGEGRGRVAAGVREKFANHCLPEQLLSASVSKKDA